MALLPLLCCKDSELPRKVAFFWYLIFMVFGILYALYYAGAAEGETTSFCESGGKAEELGFDTNYTSDCDCTCYYASLTSPMIYVIAA